MKWFITSWDDEPMYNIKTMGFQESGSAANMIPQKDLSSIVTPRAVALDHFVHMLDINLMKSSPSV
jgi:hypothetical protein